MWNLNRESIFRFCRLQEMDAAWFGAIGVSACIFVRDFLAVRGLLAVMSCCWPNSHWIPRALARFALAPGSRGLGLLMGRGWHLVYDLALADAGPAELGHSQ